MLCQQIASALARIYRYSAAVDHSIGAQVQIPRVPVMYVVPLRCPSFRHRPTCRYTRGSCLLVHLLPVDYVSHF